MAKIRLRNLGRVVAILIRAVGRSLRLEVEDRAGILTRGRPNCIWAFWHNRMWVIPYIHELWAGHVPGAILTSPSGDGQIIADACAEFGFDAARGSSSKPLKGLAALILLADKLKEGRDVGITPDGPRGPRYQIQPGIIKLAQLTGSAIVPVRVIYSRALRFKTWDHFMIPLPFSRVRIIFEPLIHCPRQSSPEAFEALRLQLQNQLPPDDPQGEPKTQTQG